MAFCHENRKLRPKLPNCQDKESSRKHSSCLKTQKAKLLPKIKWRWAVPSKNLFFFSLAEQCTPSTPVPGRLRQWDQEEFKVKISYTVNVRPTWATRDAVSTNPCQKKHNKQKQSTKKKKPIIHFSQNPNTKWVLYLILVYFHMIDLWGRL